MSERKMSRRLIAPSLLTGASLAVVLLIQAAAVQGPALVRGNAPGEWRYWGADAWSTRYSSLDQINASNFNSLQVAWRWNAGTFGNDEYYRTTPIFANGHLLTLATERRTLFSLDPETGKVLWQWGMDEGIRWQKAPRRFAGRGFAYWTDGREERAIVVLPGYHLASIDAKTGKPDPAFGKNGVVDLELGLGYPLVPLAVDDPAALIISEGAPMRKAKPGEKWDAASKTGADGSIGIDPAEGEIAASSPPIVVGNVIVVGNSSIHGYYPIKIKNIPGFIRGFDVHTGKQLWKFNLIPQPGEFGANTWKNGSKVGTNGVGKNDAWAPYSADPELGLVYIPVGEGLNDRYGGNRPGNNLFANSIVALDAKTGVRKWHFQMVHHDIWDYDTPMAPNILDVTVNGQKRKVIAASTKQGWVYVFDRVTGAPIWPMPETPVGASEVPGEETAPTQPIPSKPAPYAQQGLIESDLIDYTPAIKDSALKLAKRCRMGPYFIPISPSDGKGAKGATQYNCSWYAPGASGGVNIDGGTAADPETGMIYVGGQSGLQSADVLNDPCSEQHYIQPPGVCGIAGALPTPPGYVAPGGRGGRGAAGGAGGGGGGGGAGGGFQGRATTSIGGVSIVKPKQLGGVTAYNLNTGDKAWWSPNGGQMLPVTSTDPLFAGVKLPPAPSQGSQAQIIVTKTLTIYGTGRSGMAPTQLFALDKATGKQVGALSIPSKTTAVPMTFLYHGKQYILFAAGAGTSIELVALRLP